MTFTEYAQIEQRTCSVPDCPRKLNARGFCKMHYARWLKHGSPGDASPLRVSWTLYEQCTIDGCDRKYFTAGVCSGHYSRRLRKGSAASESPLEFRFHNPEEAFKAQTRQGNGCHEWTGWLSPDGYGKFTTGGKNVFAHRYAWERENGPIPEGMEIDHACHNASCVNAEHLRLATHSENTRNLAGPTANNKHSGVRNVGKTRDRWRVRITKDGITHSLGCFDDLEEASAVAKEGRARLFGQFAGRG